MSLQSKNNSLSLTVLCLIFPWGTSNCAPPRIRSLTFFCSCHRTSSQRKDQEYRRPARTTAGIRICPSIRPVSRWACASEVRAPSPREVKAAGLAPSDGWGCHDRAPAHAGRMWPWHPPAPHLAPSWHHRAQGTGAASPRDRPAGTRAGCQQPANPALQGLYAVTSPGAARDITRCCSWRHHSPGTAALRPPAPATLREARPPRVATPAQVPAPPHRRPAPGLPSAAQALTAACYDITR